MLDNKGDDQMIPFITGGNGMIWKSGADKIAGQRKFIP